MNLHDDYGSTVLKDVTVPTSVAAYMPAEPVDHGEQFATLLETNCATMRRSMMVSLHCRKGFSLHTGLMHHSGVVVQDFYRELKSSLKQAQCQALEAERRTSAAQLYAKNSELESACTALTASNDRCADLDGMLWKAATLVANLNQRIRLRRLLASQINVWRAAVAWAKHERQLLKKAEDWCDILLLMLQKGWEGGQANMAKGDGTAAACDFRMHHVRSGTTLKFSNAGSSSVGGSTQVCP